MDWEINRPISIQRFHLIKFENKGVVLRCDKGKRLSYSHLSSVFRLTDSYSILKFMLAPTEKGTLLTLDISNFPTATIRKHREFYWRTTIVNIKNSREFK